MQRGIDVGRKAVLFAKAEQTCHRHAALVDYDHRRRRKLYCGYYCSPLSEIIVKKGKRLDGAAERFGFTCHRERAPAYFYRRRTPTRYFCCREKLRSTVESKTTMLIADDYSDYYCHGSFDSR